MQQEQTKVKPLLVDAQAASAMLAIAPRTLSEMTRRGVIPSLKIGALRRYRIEALEAWLRAKEATNADQ